MWLEKEELLNIAPFLFCNEANRTKVRVNVVVCTSQGE